VAAVPVRGAGSLVEHHPLFPQGVNVGFAEIRARDRIALRVWERGAGETQACGTAACAATVAAHRRGLTDRKAAVELPGGVLEIEWREADGHVLMTGPVELEFEGRLP
jgi:diaminopimelate epimerase